MVDWDGDRESGATLATWKISVKHNNLSKNDKNILINNKNHCILSL